MLLQLARAERVARVFQNWAELAAPWHGDHAVNSLGEIVQKALPIAILALATVGVPVLLLEPEGYPRMRALQAELDGVREESTELKRDIGRLRLEVQRLRDDPAAVERIARDQLGLVRKSEVVFQFAKGK